ncbi:MAG: signal peptidase I [Lachnospiraceae bacterium]|nr:signal peptidase I [Lachnospiraceae bacterium]
MEERSDGSGIIESSTETTEELKKTIGELEEQLSRIRFRRTLRSTAGTLIVVAAIAVLMAMLWVPVLRIYGSSMSSTLRNREVVMAMRYADFQTGDVIAFSYNNRILIKHVIAKAGDEVNLDVDGNVYVNGELIDEPYLTEKAVGETDIEYPYQVPEGRIFVKGDNRAVSVDSRHTAVGCVAEEQVIGKLFLRIWPLGRFGII